MENSLFYSCKEVMELLGCCESKAYRIMKEMNKELQKKGYITMSGKVPKAYFNEKVYGGDGR